MHKNKIITIFQFHFCWSRFICRFFFNFVTKWVTYTLDFFLFMSPAYSSYPQKSELHLVFYAMLLIRLQALYERQKSWHPFTSATSPTWQKIKRTQMNEREHFSPELLEYHNKRRLTWRRILKKQQDKIHRENSNQRSQTMTKKLHKPILLYFLRTLF